MAHSHSHSGGHDHSHGGADLSSLVDSDALARIAGSGLLGSGAPRWLLSADAFHARHVARIDGAFKAAAALAAAHWAATVVGGLGRREESGVTRTRPLLRLLRVCFPSPWCAESLLAAAYAAVLVARTAAGVAVVTGEARVVEWVLARASGGSSSDHGSHSHGHSHGYSHGHSHSHGTDHGHGKRSAFVALVALVFRHMIVAAVPNVLATGLLVYIEKTLAAGFRRRLTDHLTRMYLLGRKGGAPNYHAIRKVLVDPGERITRDADRFAKGLADVGGCLVGPIVDFVGFAAAAWSWMRGSGSRQTEVRRRSLSLFWTSS